MTIPIYNAQEHGALDGTPGYNDSILTCRLQTEGESCSPLAIDDLPVDPNTGLVDTYMISTNWRNPPQSVVDMYSSRRGAQIFRLPGVVMTDADGREIRRSGIIVRRSIFDVACKGDIILARNYNLTPNQVRAIAAFSDSGYNNMWCFAPESGHSYADGAPRPYQTPWNLQSREGLLAFKTAIESVLAGNASNASQRRALADLSDEDRASLRTMTTEIDQQVKELQSATDSFFSSPWFHLLSLSGVGVVFFLVHVTGHIWSKHYDARQNEIDRKKDKDKRNGSDDDDQDPPSRTGGDRLAALEATVAELKAQLGQQSEAAGESSVAEFSANVEGLQVPLPLELAHLANTSYSTVEDFIAAAGYNPSEVVDFSLSLMGELPMTLPIPMPEGAMASMPLEQGALQYSGATPEGTFTTSSLLGGMMELGGEGAPVYGSVLGLAPELSSGSGVPGVVTSAVPPPMAPPVLVPVPVAPVAVPAPVLVMP